MLLAYPLTCVDTGNQSTTGAASLQETESEIARFSEHHFVPLPHPPRMEAMFHQEIASERRDHLTLYGLGALVVYDFFLVGDYLISPEHFVRSLSIRLGIITPLVLVFMWLLRKPRWAPIREGSAVALCFVACCSILLLHGRADLFSIVQSEPGIVMVLLCMNVVLRIDFLYAVAGTLLCFAAETCFLVSSHVLTTANRFTIGGRVFWVSVLTLLASYSMARQQRLSWLQRLHSRVQRRLLADVNAELVNLSATDRLTGISNRYGYDIRLAQLWEAAVSRGQLFSVIMVDVDHFKLLNDSFGHPYGDRVLQRIASLLQQALRAEDDFAARIGGEEFIVLLPNSDAGSAFRVAERIRLLVQVAGSPGVRGDGPLSADESWSTVSCGTATAVASPLLDPQRVVDAADAALYRAKQAGRNCVQASSPLTHQDASHRPWAEIDSQKHP